MPHINRFSASSNYPSIRITGVRNDSDKAVFNELSDLLNNFYGRVEDYNLQTSTFTPGRSRYELNLVKTGISENFEYLDDGSGRVRIYGKNGKSRIKDSPVEIIGQGKIVICPKGFTQKIDRPPRRFDYAVARHEFREALFDVYFNRKANGRDSNRTSEHDRNSFLNYVERLGRRYEVLK
ncbi:hypothetical protein HN385_00560 [archaeon]|jgi:hypothetical protein|nr:hypothetical protein [archaeon]MBT3451585.1 hypothetical protein [archaeon]MBT6869605.1 hypothetical protein [archaeon]MBT7192374.1 hypothetical protein [archaeon]MBT7380175.1 hypothetical protein [archaeon]